LLALSGFGDTGLVHQLGTQLRRALAFLKRIFCKGDRKMMTQNLEQVWFDRDLAWLEFNRRVLAEALDERTPLLERIKFLAIFTSNQDEFFMKRIAVLRVEKDKSRTKLLSELRAVTVGMVQQQKACFAALLPQLERHGIRILSWKDLTERSVLQRQHSSSGTFSRH
jgi:polyphosphate kinase